MTDPSRAFLPVLRRLDRELRVALPMRLRILRELELDLLGLRGHLERGGVPAEEARRRAEEALVPGEETLRVLGALHQPLYVRATAALNGDRLRMAERSALIGSTALVLVSQTLLLAGTGLLEDPSPFLWPVLGLGALVFALTARGVFRLHVRQDWSDPDPTLVGILVSAASTLAAGVVGAGVDLFRLAAVLEVSAQPAAPAVTAWLIRDCTLLAVAILIAVAGGLVWFVLAQRAAAVRAERGRLLGIDVLPSIHSAERSSP